jgi:hypothetical protein
LIDRKKGRLRLNHPIQNGEEGNAAHHQYQAFSGASKSLSSDLSLLCQGCHDLLTPCAKYIDSPSDLAQSEYLFEVITFLMGSHWILREDLVIPKDKIQQAKPDVS